MKASGKTLILTTLLCLLPMLAGVFLYPRLPETIATHFAMDGTPNGWSGKNFAVFGLPALIAGVHLVMQLAMSADPKKQNVNPALQALILWLLPALSCFVSYVTLGNALGHRTHVETVTPLLLGVLFIVLGRFLPKTKQNGTVGIKLPWTLASEENWNRTHRLAGVVWTAAGVLCILLSLLRLWNTWLFLGVMLALVVIPAVYSFLLSRRGV